MPPTLARRGSSVTQSLAGLAKRSRCTGPGKPTPARATRTPCASISADAARVDSSTLSFPVMHRVSYAIATSALGFLRPAAIAAACARTGARASTIWSTATPTISSASVGSPERAERIFWAIVRGGSPARPRMGRCFSTATARDRGARTYRGARVLTRQTRRRARARPRALPRFSARSSRRALDLGCACLLA